jgi:ribosomal protein L35AE/L33A
MIGSVLIGVILVILILAQLVNTAVTSGELQKLRQSIKTLDIRTKSHAERIVSTETKYNTRSRNGQYPKESLRGELDIYHGNKTATVQAVFRPK